ncbi:uncharacterized protein LOC106164325 [Lingula anatina]|uniref:Uncharacterized protein LOC106164325 n=1 Tax=Lingula anatina TaxID=7574 RepID=A0A1S3IHC4_LINAN|nr:uncharacterized protein LOC106164325 [Lingula anatina]|eukprot:XP_013397660.1 uncharacterized protein LOC106164325 [Lingula anatina]
MATWSLCLMVISTFASLQFATALYVVEPCSGAAGVPPGKNCRDVPVAERVPPLYPKQFVCRIQGWTGFPAQPNATFRVHVQQDNLWLFDYPNLRLRFAGPSWVGFLKLNSNFTHTGTMSYTTLPFLPNFCLCNDVGIGILKYDAFGDATFLGRETITIEYEHGDHEVDHYEKLGHHFWMDVATKLPIRFFQEGAGLQVYSEWSQQVNANDFMLPERCFGDCNKNPVHSQVKDMIKFGINPLAYARAAAIEVLRGHK